MPGPVAAPTLRAGEAWISIDVPVTALEAEFERHVPRMLAAEEDRPIGSPGLVTYRVTRGKPRLRAADGRLTATLPVEIDLSLCKPLGSLCIGYGSCTPAYDVKATWDLTLSSHHELPDVRLSQKVREGCRVGVDVTEHVTSVVRDQLAAIEQQIDGRRPALSPWIDRAISELTRPSMLAAGQCVALEPKELLLDGPTISGDRFTLGVGLAGTMIPANCEALPHRGRGLPVRRVTERSEAPSLELREHLADDAFAQALDHAISSASRPGQDLALRQHAFTLDGVLLAIELHGQECGVVWATAELGVHDARLALEKARLLTGDLPEDRVREIEATLEVPLEVQSSTPRWLSELSIVERTEILGTLLREHSGLELSAVPPEIASADVITAADGLWITTAIRSRLDLRGRPREAP